MEEDVQDKINRITQVISAEMDAIARRECKTVDPIARLEKWRVAIEAAGLPLPDHMKRPTG
ncbi:MAG: hypothetical protein JKX97_03495 [Candidatus Lindowbacteria bacterium]|nr:hypothetical protein [Candidatus Lindowbacteria bacterium]